MCMYSRVSVHLWVHRDGSGPLWCAGAVALIQYHACLHMGSLLAKSVRGPVMHGHHEFDVATSGAPSIRS